MMVMAEKISESIWKIQANSNIYILNFGEWIAIDAGDRAYHDDVLKEIKEIIPAEKITKVLFTHLHYDHTGNMDLFPNAEFYAGEEEIKAYNENHESATLGEKLKIKLKPLPKEISGLDVIHTPGHTGGSVCFYYKDKKIMFSGDTLFFNNNFGRTDLPTSVPGEMKKSLDKISKYKIDILCPGHDY